MVRLVAKVELSNLPRENIMMYQLLTALIVIIITRLVLKEMTQPQNNSVYVLHPPLSHI
jgi:hypothetical protein